MNNITYKIYVNAINQRMLESESEHKDGKTKPEDFDPEIDQLDLRHHIGVELCGWE